MANFGATELRLVNPLPFDMKHALALACDGEKIVKKAGIFSSCEQALYDCHFSIATTRRTRHIGIKTYIPATCLNDAIKHKISRIAIVFGNEKSGLSNTELYSCDIVSTISTTDHGSLNLSQAVLVYLYEWYNLISRNINLSNDSMMTTIKIPEHHEKSRLFELFETLITEGGYQPKEKISGFIRKIRMIYETRPISQRELRIMLTALRWIEKRGHRTIKRI